MRLKDKVIVVVGGNGLLGKSIVSQVLSEDGVCINVDINPGNEEDKYHVKCDVTNEDSIENALKHIYKEFGQVDGLVNCAYPRTSDWGNKFELISANSWKLNVDMQMNSVFVVCQKVLQYMKQQQRGSIVNISSIYGTVAPDFSIYEGTNITMPAAYSAIKAGVINFTKYLAAYFGEYNIRVNCVSPGGIFDSQNEIFVRNYVAKVPLGRMGTPDDVSLPVCFFLSEESKYITGHNLIVDGGWTAI